METEDHVSQIHYKNAELAKLRQDNEDMENKV